MAKYNGGGMGGNMQGLMKQAQKMQKDMEKLQAEAETKIVEASAGGGAVKVVVTGAKQIQSITIEPSAVDPDDIEMLQDLILAATNEALRAADEMMNGAMGKLTGGMNLGGLF